MQPGVHWAEALDYNHLTSDEKKATMATTFGYSISFLNGELLDRIQQILSSGKTLELFWITLPDFYLFTKLYGREVGEQIMAGLAESLPPAAAGIAPREQLVHVDQADHSSLLILASGQAKGLKPVMDQALHLRTVLREGLNKEVVTYTGQRMRLEVGCALLNGLGGGDLEGRLYHALGDARQVAEGVLDVSRLGLTSDFRELIETPLLTAVYQPIVNLSSAEVLGWEALARGPKGHSFARPNLMFDFAEEAGFLFQLERTCREAAITGLGELDPRQRLFLNIHPLTLGDPSFRPGETKRLLAAYGLDPSQVVFEITERHSIQDFRLFHQTLDHYRNQGFAVAIDDVGTGFSGLNRIAQLRPDYLKADMDLVRGVDANHVQRALLETLVTLADRIGCEVIAEGVETETELSTLVSIGVHLGQGFFLDRPAAPKPEPKVNLPVKTYSTRRGSENWSCSIPIRQLVEQVPQVSPQTPVRRVKALLDSSPISGVVVVHNHRPAGLVMSHSLDRQLGAQYGTALYFDRPVKLVMDSAPLIVEADAPVEKVAKKAMSRDRFKLYDHIVVTENGRTSGVVSVQKMLDAMARVQVEMAKGANPLTGLPGNLTLEMEIEKVCNCGQASSIIYVDLDNFKAYNDGYGFEAGDKMIRLAAHILGWAIRRHGGPDSFLGHVGGDDFVVITDRPRAERVCRGVIRCFGRLVKDLYRPEDVMLGYIEGKSRDGQPSRFPLVTISLGIVDCDGLGADLSQISRYAADVKRYAKSIPGNSFVRERRRLR